MEEGLAGRTTCLRSTRYTLPNGALLSLHAVLVLNTNVQAGGLVQGILDTGFRSFSQSLGNGCYPQSRYMVQ